MLLISVSTLTAASSSSSRLISSSAALRFSAESSAVESTRSCRDLSDFISSSAFMMSISRLLSSVRFLQRLRQAATPANAQETTQDLRSPTWFSISSA